MKDWILQYAEEASSGSDADEIDQDNKEPEKNSEMEERFDPVSMKIILN